MLKSDAERGEDPVSFTEEGNLVGTHKSRL